MTDKPLIVDNIDVSKCEFLIISNDKHLCRCIKSDLFGGIEFVENAKNGNCKDNPNCYYKQLKRKEQECEELKKANDGILTTIRILAKNNIKLREVLTEIKEITETFYNACKELKLGRKGRNCMYCNYSKILQKTAEV